MWQPVNVNEFGAGSSVHRDRNSRVILTLQVRHASVGEFSPGKRERGEVRHAGEEGEALIGHMEEVCQVERGEREGGDGSHGLIHKQVSVRELQALQLQT